MAEENLELTKGKELSFEEFKAEILEDFRIANVSRETSLLGRREVLTGKAKFGIFGDGKEIAQIAMAKQFKNGDWRSGYYRDQTFMMAIGAINVQEYFAALYAHTDLQHEPSSAGRQMGGHFATRSLNDDGSWKNLMEQKNSSADISPTAGQMPRLLGLAQASKVFKNNPDLHQFTSLTNKGEEVAFGTIGDASTSEGLFWETINAAGVLQVPLVMSIWDDGFGISVPKKYQTTKASISEALSGMEMKEGDESGFKMFNVKGWDYQTLCTTYSEAVAFTRENHVPAFIHVEEVTQPQGHSTSGSHERYKSPERLAWALEYDCIAKFKTWIIEFGEKTGQAIASTDELDEIQKVAKKHVREAKAKAWKNFVDPIKQEVTDVSAMIETLAAESENGSFLTKIAKDLSASAEPIRKEIVSSARHALRIVRSESLSTKQRLLDYLNESKIANHDRYSSYLHSHSKKNALDVNITEPTYPEEANLVDGRIVLRDNFEYIFENNPLVLTFGEDVGKIGGVNQSMEGMQEKFGELRVSDTGIREATILGQGIGMAMRGLRPIAEIQYLDYILYCIQIMSDDLATVQYRTKGGQKAPLIIRTRGHRLEGIWHAGSPMAGIINLLRGVYICVPRNMVKAAGFYNTLLDSDDTALVVECLNGYRTKESMPSNIGEFKTPLGIPEITREGTDITIVSYGSTFNMCTQAANDLQAAGISAELIDVQTLLPFDINHMIVESLKKTNRVLFVDEDVPGGTTAYMMQKVLEEQGGFYHLDSEPKTLSAKDHRPAYGSDGDYFSKPGLEDIFDAAYELMHESNPTDFPRIY
ncbi:MAG: 2-oxoisovalerate dehydrogenase E1 component [Parvicellaceae bacterium]|jgi:2-oxoisovalerate dehydrogenase E1 component